MIPTKKTYQFNAEYQTDDLDFAVGVSLFDQNDNMVFSAWNLNECPEDAVIGRDLFDEKDFIKAVKLGMELQSRDMTMLSTSILRGCMVLKFKCLRPM